MYIQEAHPSDGWQLPVNEREDVVYRRAKSNTERKAVASQCRGDLKLSIPCVVDNVENEVDNMYAGWPERMFVIAPDGRIAYAGEQGPWGFKVDETRQALKDVLGRSQDSGTP